ncbi:MAG: hypothetical protein WCN92_02870 [Eubacteriales bacterium]
MPNNIVPYAKRKIPNLPSRFFQGRKFLDDNKDWKNRFEIHSETSDRVYTIAQHKVYGHMGCSCMGWKRYRTCKHLTALGLPGHEEPVNLDPFIDGNKFGI